MKAVRGVHEHMTKSIGVTTGNHLVADGIQRNYPTGPRLQVAPGEPLPPPKIDSQKRITVVYNSGNCYKCGGSNTVAVQAFTSLNLRSCNKCKVVFLAEKEISEEEYLRLF